MTERRRDLLLVALMFASGTIDAIAFLGLGKVFTSFQTGNLVFVGIKAVQAGGPRLGLAIDSLVAFAVGVAIAARLIGHGVGIWPRRVCVALGLALAVEAAFLAVWVATGGRPSGETCSVLVPLSAVAMGLQSGAVMSLGVKGVFTTAATATVILLARDLAATQSASRDEQLRLAAVLAALVAGAATGGLLLVHARPWAPAAPLLATAAVVTASLRSRRAIT